MSFSFGSTNLKLDNFEVARCLKDVYTSRGQVWTEGKLYFVDSYGWLGNNFGNESNIKKTRFAAYQLTDPFTGQVHTGPLADFPGWNTDVSIAPLLGRTRLIINGGRSYYGTNPDLIADRLVTRLNALEYLARSLQRLLLKTEKNGVSNIEEP